MIAGLNPYPAYKDSGVPWLGDVPAHWEVRRLKQICRLAYGNALDADARQGGAVPVFGSNGSVGFHNSANTESPCIVIGRKGSFGKVNFSYGPVFAIDTTFYVDEHFSSADIRWLFFLLGTLGLDQVTKDSAIPGLDREDVYQRVAALPPLPEQAAIVRFLDHADRRIRRYIRAKQKLIALLEEQKQVLIHQAVTGQIDVRTGRPFAAYRSSGIKWLGDLPEHWEVRRSKRAFMPRKELARSDDIQLSATQAYGVIAQEEYEKRVGRKVVKIVRNLEQRRHVEVDDFVISMRSFQGGLERAWASGCIRSSYIVLQPAVELNVGYFGYLFKSLGYISSLQSTANFIRDGQDLNFENFCCVDLPFPPIGEQRRIEQALDRAIFDIGSAIERSRQRIDLLNEYRTRLIADVVTGKLDVHEAAAALPDIDPLAAEDDLDETFAADDSQIDNENEPVEAAD